MLAGLAAVSLLLWGLTIAIWISSYAGDRWVPWFQPNFRSHTPNFSFQVYVIRGEIHVLWFFSSSSSGWINTSYYNAIPNRLGFAENHMPRGAVPAAYRGSSHLGVIILPVWLPFVTFTAIATLLLARLYRWRRIQKRARMGLCVSCGYDLRATPDRCPECGTISPMKTQAKLID
jgi:hypothetical protein